MRIERSHTMATAELDAFTYISQSILCLIAQKLIHDILTVRDQVDRPGEIKIQVTFEIPDVPVSTGGIAKDCEPDILDLWKRRKRLP